MKIPRHLLCLLIAAAAILPGQIFAQSYYMLDFGNSGQTVVTGFTGVTANFLSNTPVANVSNINGSGVNFSIDNVGSYNSGNAGEPLTTDGFYTFGNETNEHSFTISGLTVGQTVTLYAVSGWDGNGRGASVTFGGSSTLAAVQGDPGANPTLANFTQINLVSALVGPTGILTGLISGHNSPTDEGQVGAFIFEVNDLTAIPEPSSVAGSIILGIVGLFGLQRYRRRQTA